MIDQQRLDEIVHRGITDLGDSADGYLVNKEGVLQTNTMLGDYRDYSANSRTVESQAVNRALLELQNGNGDYIYQSIHDNYFDTRVLGSSGIVRMGGEEVALLIEVSEEEAFGHVRRVINVSLFIILISILAGLVTAIIISTMISKPLLVATRHAQQLSMFDLSKNLPNKYTTQRDEAGELASAIQTTINNIRKLMKEISNSSEMVAAMSEELTASSQQSSTVAEEVSKTIDEIAVGASDQAVSTQLGAEQASKLGGKIVENQQYLDSLNTASVKVSQVVSDGLSGVERLTIISKESTDVTKEVFEGIQNTNESANKIGAASHVIAAIADQTNLLALNAAIEAARAGEAGKGFAVVADEIRKLAEQSTMNTKAIDTVVSELQKNATDAVRRVERLVTISNEQQESIFNSKAQYLTISEAMAAAINAVEKLNVSGEEMGHLKDQIIESLQTLSAIAEQNSASTQEVSAAMEEQSASMEEIASSSEDLANLAGNLRSIINRFIV